MKIFVSLLLAVAVVLADEWSPLNPEEVAYLQSRCGEELFGGDFDLAKKWRHWKFPEGDDTACYVKCLVQSLGIFDETSNSFQSNHVKQQYDEYASLNGVREQKVSAIVNALEDLPKSDGGCESVAKAFIPVSNAHVGDLRKIFLIDHYVREKVYCANPQMKPKGISIFRFCGKQFYTDGEAAYCNVRRHGYSDDEKFIKHSNCTTRGMRWMKKNGDMDPKQIKRDLHLVNVDDKDDVVTDSLNSCQVNEESKARDYYKCLYDGLGEKLFMKVLDYIEVRSEDYNYRLHKDTSKYDAAAMRTDVQTLDADAQCPPLEHGKKEE